MQVSIPRLFLLLAAAVTLHCQADRMCFICPEPPCSVIQPVRDTLFITGFEQGADPTEYLGALNPWHDTLSGIQVQVFYDSTGGGAKGSRYYAKLALNGNSGHSANNWSGGGLVLNFSDCPEGTDISAYDSVQFEAKVFPGSNLDEMRVKLEDAVHDSIPERFLAQFNPTFPSPEWISISIPLDEFKVTYITDPILHPQWVDLDKRRVVRLVTTMVNTPVSPKAKDGVLGIDNVRFVKK